MHKLRQAFQPYSYRGKLQLLMVLSTAIACLLSLGVSYAYSHYSTRVNLADDEYNMAIAMLELEQKTELDLGEIIAMTAQDNLAVYILPSAAELGLSEPEINQLNTRTILTVLGNYANFPVTYVQMRDSVLCIAAPSRRIGPVLMSIFWRTGFISLSFAIVFLLIALFSTARMSKPISQLTKATQQVSEGDFTVHLPETHDDELGDLYHSFNSMTDALARTSWLQKDFIASISHEFRTPIASIKGYARLLKTPGLDEEKRREYVETIAQESDRLSRLSETLLRLTALEQQASPASISSFRLDEQVRQVILRLEPVWDARAIEFDLNLDPVTIETDCELLTQVWINLIHNAVKYSEPGGLIEITVRRTDMAEFEITDHGIGMSEETVQRIFDRFYQADPSRSREGVGLGLCLVQRILDILCGEIRVRSKLQEGTTMRVRLPLTPQKKTHHKEESNANNRA